MGKLVIGGTYRHFKGELYRVLLVAINSETQGEMVVYPRTREPRVYPPTRRVNPSSEWPVEPKALKVRGVRPSTVTVGATALAVGLHENIRTGKTWVRPLKIFLEKVKQDSKSVKRFTLISRIRN